MATFIIGGIVFICIVLAAAYAISRARQGKCVGCDGCSGNCSCSGTSGCDCDAGPKNDKLLN